MWARRQTELETKHHPPAWADVGPVQTVTCSESGVLVHDFFLLLEEVEHLRHRFAGIGLVTDGERPRIDAARNALVREWRRSRAGG